MKLRVDTRGVGFFCTRDPEVRTDHDTGAVKLDRETSKELWRVQLAALDSSGGEILAVTVAGQPEVAIGSPVEVTGLVAIPWSQGERSGVAYRADSIRATGTPIAGVITPTASPAAEGKRPSGGGAQGKAA